MNELVFIVGVHGNERVPVRVVKRFCLKSDFIIAHPRAIQENVRYLETDLNRSFPGNFGGSVEERLAFKLLPRINKYKRVIDLHTSSCQTLPFVIFTHRSPEHLKLALKTGIRKMVHMNKKFASGRALIDHVSVGISIECGPEKKKRTGEIVASIISNVAGGGKRESLAQGVEFYNIFGVLTKEIKKETLTQNVRPFVLVKRGEIITKRGKKAGEDFYPILPRSKSYKNFLCLMARKTEPFELKAIKS